MEGSVQSISNLVKQQLSQSLNENESLAFIAIALILFGVYCFFNNIQRSFNHIWKSKDRKIKKALILYLELLLCISIALGFFVAIFNNMPSSSKEGHASFLQCCLSGIALFFFISTIYRIVPYDKKPRYTAVFVAAFPVTIIILCWTLCLPLVAFSSQNVINIRGIRVFLAVFWIFWSWIILLAGAIFCRRWEKRGYYLHDEIEGIAPYYKRFLTVLVLSHIYREYDKKGGNRGLCFEEIRQGMFEFEDEKGKHNTNVVLSMALLDEIIDFMVKDGLLSFDDRRNKVLYYPEHIYPQDKETNRDYKTYCIGDILFALDFKGHYKLDYPYYLLRQPLDAELTRGMVNFCRETPFMNKLVIDLKPDKVLEKPKLEQIDIADQKFNWYLSNLNPNDGLSLMRNSYKALFNQVKDADKKAYYDSTRDSIMNSPDEYNKEASLIILDEVAKELDIIQ